MWFSVPDFAGWLPVLALVSQVSLAWSVLSTLNATADKLCMLQLVPSACLSA